jgi:hypothetical protein
MTSPSLLASKVVVVVERAKWKKNKKRVSASLEQQQQGGIITGSYSIPTQISFLGIIVSDSRYSSPNLMVDPNSLCFMVV